MKISTLQSKSSSNKNSQSRIQSAMPTFGIANSCKLKTLFSYGLPCMYTGIEMIDPKKIQTLLNKNAFNAPVSQVMETIQPFEKSIIDVEFRVYKILKKAAKRFPECNLQQLLKNIAPNFRYQLKSEQMPIINEILQVSKELPEDNKYRFQQLIAESEDKINEKPIYLPFSSFEFKYKLDKICEDILQIASPKAIRVMNKLTLEASRLTNDTDNSTIETQQSIIKFLKIILKSSVLKKNEQLKTLLNDSQKRLNYENLATPFTKKTFIYDMNNILKSVKDEDLKNRLINIALRLPTSRNSVAAYIMKFSREPSWKIGYRLLWPNMASIEHILPSSKGGKDEMANFGGAGTRVNSERGNIDFVEQIKRLPDTSKNSQKYVSFLTKLVKKGVFCRKKIPTGYIDDFCNTIAIQSLNEIRINTKELQEYREKGNLLSGILVSLAK